MCGLFGIVNYRGAKPDIVKKLATTLALASESRGTDAGGVAFYNAEDRLEIVRNKGKISTNGVMNSDEIYSSQIIMGHTRMTTQGVATLNYNNHPFPSAKKTYALAHNGVLSNDAELDFELGLKETKVTTDSYIFNRILDEKYDGVVNFENLKKVAEMVSGTFNFTILDNSGNLWIIRHNNPLVILNIEELGLIAYSSTADILSTALNKLYDGGFINYLMARISMKRWGVYIKTDSGEIVKIDTNGKVERESFTPATYTYSYPTYGGSRTGTTFRNGYDEYDNDDATWYRQAKGTVYNSKTKEWEHFSDRSLQTVPKIGNKDVITTAKNLKTTLFDGYEPDNQVIIFNGVEDEVVTYYPRQENVFSFMLGKMIPNPYWEKKEDKDPNPLVITTEELLNPMTFVDIKPLMYDHTYVAVDTTMVPKLLKYLETLPMWADIMRLFARHPQSLTFMKSQLLCYLLTHFILTKYDDDISRYYRVENFDIDVNGGAERNLRLEVNKIASYQSVTMAYKYIQSMLRLDMLMFTESEYLFEYASEYVQRITDTETVGEAVDF